MHTSCGKTHPKPASAGRTILARGGLLAVVGGVLFHAVHWAAMPVLGSVLGSRLSGHQSQHLAGDIVMLGGATWIATAVIRTARRRVVVLRVRTQS